MQPLSAVPQINPAFYYEATEFIRHESIPGRAYGITAGVRHEYQNTSLKNKAIIKMHIANLPGIKSPLKRLATINGVSIDEQFAYCILGDCDNIADINQNGELQMDEPNGCPMLGTCPFASSVCLKLKGSKSQLSDRQIQILSHFPKSAKEIADTMCLSVETVYTHEQNMRMQLGLVSRVELGIYAAKNNII